MVVAILLECSYTWESSPPPAGCSRITLSASHTATFFRLLSVYGTPERVMICNTARDQTQRLSASSHLRSTASPKTVRIFDSRPCRPQRRDAERL